MLNLYSPSYKVNLFLLFPSLRMETADQPSLKYDKCSSNSHSLEEIVKGVIMSLINPLTKGQSCKN